MDRNTPLELLSDLSDASNDGDDEWEDSRDSDGTGIDHDWGDSDNNEWMSNLRVNWRTSSMN